MCLHGLCVCVCVCVCVCAHVCVHVCVCVCVCVCMCVYWCVYECVVHGLTFAGNPCAGCIIVLSRRPVDTKKLLSHQNDSVKVAMLAVGIAQIRIQTFTCMHVHTHNIICYIHTFAHTCTAYYTHNTYSISI